MVIVLKMTIDYLYINCRFLLVIGDELVFSIHLKNLVNSIFKIIILQCTRLTF
jgi:hypothetical protein